MSGQTVAILGVGMVTAVGIGAPQTSASVRAGISRFSSSTFYDRRFQPFVVAAVPDEHLPPLAEPLGSMTDVTVRLRRMLRLATPALLEALGDRKAERIPLFLCAPEPYAGRRAPADRGFLEHLNVQSGSRFDLKRSLVFPRGRAAVFHALQEAMSVLATSKDPFVLVGGVDTYLDPYALGTLDMEDRVRAQGVMDGFVPGEGAGFLLLGPDFSAKTLAQGAPLARIVRTAVATERGHRYSAEPHRGDGLAQAFREVFAQTDKSGPVQTVYAGLNGESLGAKEWGVAYLRSRALFADPLRIEHPVDCFGDTGAALGPLLIGLAALGMRTSKVSSPCLVWCASDREERGAAVIRNVAA